MRVKINVTKADIERGAHFRWLKEKNGIDEFNCSAISCPVFQALKRGGYEVDYVGSTIVRIRNEFIVKNYPLPEKAEKFIDRFDNKKTVKPFSFMLDIPAEFCPKKTKSKRQNKTQ